MPVRVCLVDTIVSMAKHILVLILVLALADQASSASCPFNPQLPDGPFCVCLNQEASDFTYRRAACIIPNRNQWYPFDAAPIGSCSIVDQLSLSFRSASVSLPARSFASLKLIDHLLIENQYVDQLNLTCDHLAFIGTSIKKFTTRRFQNVLPPSDALLNLGLNGLESLTIQDGNAVDLEDFEFAKFVTLKSLTLDNIEIRSINDSAFFSLLPTITHLALTKAKLSKYPLLAFKDLPQLEVLDLSDNLMTDFPPAAFSNFRNLRELRLAGNVIQEAIDARAFYKLPETLKVLDLSRTFLSSIPKPILNQMPSILSLNLANNLINTITIEDFPAGLNLTELNLDQNPIEFIEYSAFKNLDKVRKLVIQDTKLRHLEMEIFEGLDNLERLELGFNYRLTNVTLVQPYVLPPNLKHIVLVNSSLTTINANFEEILSRKDFQLLDISDSTDLICDPSLQRFAKYVFCQPQRLLIDGARCANLEGIHLNTYLFNIDSTPCD